MKLKNTLRGKGCGGSWTGEKGVNEGRRSKETSTRQKEKGNFQKAKEQGNSHKAKGSFHDAVVTSTDHAKSLPATMGAMALRRHNISNTGTQTSGARDKGVRAGGDQDPRKTMRMCFEKSPHFGSVLCFGALLLMSFEVDIHDTWSATPHHTHTHTHTHTPAHNHTSTPHTTHTTHTHHTPHTTHHTHHTHYTPHPPHPPHTHTGLSKA